MTLRGLDSGPSAGSATDLNRQHNELETGYGAALLDQEAWELISLPTIRLVRPGTCPEACLARLQGLRSACAPFSARTLQTRTLQRILSRWAGPTPPARKLDKAQGSCAARQLQA